MKPLFCNWNESQIVRAYEFNSVRYDKNKRLVEIEVECFTLLWLRVNLNTGTFGKKENSETKRFNPLQNIRPCVRWKFPNYFREFQKSSIFEVLNFFGNNWNFWTRKNFPKKFGNLSLEKSSDINQNCTSITKISNKTT